MEWNMKAASWDLGELDEATKAGFPSIEETIDFGSSRFGSDDDRRRSNKGEFCVDLKLGTQVGNSRSCSSNEPAVVGAKWKDVVGGASSKVMMMTSSSSSSSSSGSSSKRARAINNGGIQTVSCLVDGCNSDLSNCREYHRRHKVCEMHSKTPVVTINGLKQRFCQQCSRFHSLEEFDEGKRSCRKRLDGHNRRRRKPQMAEGGGLVGRNYQGTLLLPFSSSHVYPPTAMAYHPPWNADVRLHHHQQQQQQHQQLFLGSSSSSSYTEASNDNNININNANMHQQIAFLRGDNSTTMESNNQQALPPPSSVCQMFLRATTPLFPAASPPLHGGGHHHDSPCALSLLSSSQTTHTSGNGLSQMVQPAMSVMQQQQQQQQNQGLGLSLHYDNGLETVDPAVLVHHGSDHCPAMYNMNEAPSPFPFHWE